MRRAARWLFTVAISLVLVFLSFGSVHAQSYTTNDDASVPQNLHTYSQNVLLEVFSAVGCQIAGIDVSSPSTPCLGFNPTTGKIGYVNSGGLIGLSTTMIAALYTPPAHLSDYTNYLSQNFGVAGHAYAQQQLTSGVGYTSISPLVEIWKVSRNLVYLVFVIIFMLVGFAIMVRFKIDPRTVMSIENQLPKLIIGLLLVTFSFAIAGLLIDGMWVGTFVVTNLITSADHVPAGTSVTPADAKTVNNNLFDNPLGFANTVLPNGIIATSLGAGGSFRDVLMGILTPDNSTRLGLIPQQKTLADCQPHDFWSLAGLPFCDITAVVNGFSMLSITQLVLGAVIANIVGAIGVVIVLVAILVAMVRVWFSLLMAYAYILLDIVIGPVLILIGMFPGSKLGFGSWVRDMLANLLAFPVTIALLLLGRVFMDTFTAPTQTVALFVPPLIGNPNGASGGGNPLGWLIGLAIILVTPGIVNQMRELLKSPQSKLGAQIFQGLGIGGKAFGGLTKNIIGTFANQEIEYDEDGRIKPVQGVRKVFKRFTKNY